MTTAASVRERSWPGNACCAVSISNSTAPKAQIVRALVHRFTARLFWTHVGGRSEDDPGLCHRWRRDRRRQRQAPRCGASRLERFREAEVEHLHRAVRTDLDVRGFQIAVNNS